MGSMPKRSDLLERFREQVRFLRADERQYDDGDYASAKRMAVVLRVLLHDQGQQVSVLSQLGVLDGLPFVDSATPQEPNGTLRWGALVLTHMFVNAGVFSHEDVPRPGRGSPYPTRDFRPWWLGVLDVLPDGRPILPLGLRAHALLQIVRVCLGTPTYSRADRDRVIALTLEPPSNGSTPWTARRVASRVAMSITTVQRIWAETGLKPHRVETFEFSTDPAGECAITSTYTPGACEMRGPEARGALTPAERQRPTPWRKYGAREQRPGRATQPTAPPGCGLGASPQARRS